MTDLTLSETTPVGQGADEPVVVSGKRLTCAISGRPLKRRDVIALGELRPSLADRIKQDFPALTDEALVSETEVARYRARYVEELLQTEHGEFTELDRQVTESIAKQDTIAENVEDEFEDTRTLGERLSDHLASFGGSWSFIIIFGVVLVVWMAINVIIGETKAFDPYPFILLNLVLSCIAALQAPVIMMSQKRQETKDRLHALNDYRVNLKAELEIRHLHEKIDYLIARQWQRHAEIQQMQMDMLQGRMRKPKFKVRGSVTNASTEAAADPDAYVDEGETDGQEPADRTIDGL